MSELLPTAEQPAPTKAEVVATILKQQFESFDRADYEQRMKHGIRKGILVDNPSIEYSLAELKVLVPLERDRLNYEWENKDKGTHGKLALNKHGLLSIGHPKGRLKPHMNKRQQAIKSASLRIFRKLFTERADLLQASAKEQKIEYLGIPDAMLPELGKIAAQLAIKEVKEARRMTRNNRRRRQQHSRKVNAGLLTISTAETRYVNRKGEYGK
jgi:hypothetical protein